MANSQEQNHSLNHQRNHPQPKLPPPENSPLTLLSVIPNEPPKSCRKSTRNDQTISPSCKHPSHGNQLLKSRNLHAPCPLNYPLSRLIWLIPPVTGNNIYLAIVNTWPGAEGCVGRLLKDAGRAALTGKINNAVNQHRRNQSGTRRDIKWTSRSWTMGVGKLRGSPGYYVMKSKWLIPRPRPAPEPRSICPYTCYYFRRQRAAGAGITNERNGKVGANGGEITKTPGPDAE